MLTFTPTTVAQLYFRYAARESLKQESAELLRYSEPGEQVTGMGKLGYKRHPEKNRAHSQVK